MGKSISPHILEIVAELYKNLLEVEKSNGVEASYRYLEEFLKDKGDDINFSNLMEEIHLFY